MNTAKLKTFNSQNIVTISALKGIVNLREESRNSIYLIVESENFVKKFSVELNNGTETNIYQYAWRTAYKRMKAKTGFCPYQILQIDESENVKLASIENLGLLPQLYITVQTILNENS